MGLQIQMIFSKSFEKKSQQVFLLLNSSKFCLISAMARETIILECTEARKEGKPPSRYMASRNKKLQTDAVEKKKYNRFLRRHTLHREIKG